MIENRFLAVDIGIDNGRCVLGILSDGHLRLDELYTFKTNVLKINGSYKWNVYGLYEHIIHALKFYSSRYGDELSSIGIDAWGLDFGILDDKGQLMGLPNHPKSLSMDLSEGVMEENLGKRRFHELSGIPWLMHSTANQLIDLCRRGELCTKYGKRLLFISDILNYFLTGSGACELSVAQISGLMDAKTRQWSGEMFDVFDIPDNFMSDLITPGQKVGTLSPSISNYCGIKQGTPVIAPVSLNLLCASVAVPQRSGTVAYLSPGSQGVCGVETEKEIINDLSYKYDIGNVKSIFGRNVLIKQTKGLGLLKECRNSWQAEFGLFSYNELIDYACNSIPFAGVVDVDDPMFDTAVHMPKAIAQYLERSSQSLTGYNNIGQISRILLESLALKYRYHFEQLKKTSLKSFDCLHTVGRGSYNALVNQFCANLLNMPVVAGPAEASAVGNMLVQAAGLGLLHCLDEMRAIVESSFELKTFYPMHVPAWDDQYEKFLKICNL